MVEVKEINEFRSSLFKGDGDALDIRRLLTFLLGLKPSLLKLDFGWHIISYFCKDGQDIDVMGLNSLILNDTPTFLSSMDFKKCDMKGIVVDQLKLICLFGMLEYLLRNDVKYNYVRISEFISPFIIDHLKTYSSDVLIQTIALAKLWWTFVCQKVFKENFDASIMRCAKIVCRCVWLHAGSTNGVVQKSVLGFFEHVLCTFLTLKKKDFSFLYNFSVLINSVTTCHSMNPANHYKLQKNSLHCLIPVLKCLGTAKVSSYVSFLVWSLLLATDDNCTLNSACDVIIMIIDEQSNSIKENGAENDYYCVLSPIIRFLLTGNVDCPMSYVPGGCCSIKATKLFQGANWDSFVHRCLTANFALLPSQKTVNNILKLPNGEVLEQCESDLLVDQLLGYLSSVFLNSKSDESQDLIEWKMFIWLKLYSLRDYFDLPSSLKQLVPVILTKSAVHHNENIRVLSLNGISKFLCKLMRTKSEDSIIDERSTHVLPLDSQIPLILMDLFLNCYSTFNTCSNPAHRKQIQQIFISLSESIRRMCKSVHLNSAEVSVILDKNNFKDDNHDSDMLFCLPDTEISLQVLQHFSDCDTMESGDFACHPPSAAMVLYLAKLIQFISSVCRSTMIHARASGQTTSQRIYTNINTYFWPGISYQRAKLLLDIIESALGVLDLAPTGPWNKKCSKWRAEFGKDSLVNLQTLIDNVSMHLNWDFKSVDSLRILFNGFLYLSPDLHSQILSIIYDHWIERKDVLTEVLYPTIIDWACVWCDAPWFSVYPAGANILAFCCINGLWNRSYFRSDIHTWLLDKLKRFLELDEGRSNNFSDNYDLSLFSNKLLHVVKFQSGLGFLLTIDQILSTCLTRLSKNPKNYKPSQLVDPMLYEFICCTELPILCLQLCNLCLFSMGCQVCHFNEENVFMTDFSKGASSFRELSMAILKTITIARRNQSTVSGTVDQLPESHLIQTLSASTSNITSDENSDVHLFNAVELLPEYQHILSWSWKTLKFCSSIIASWSAIQFKLNQKEISLDQMVLISKIGYQLLHQLLQCRHKGSIEAIYFNLLLYMQTTEAYKSSSIVVNEAVPDSQVDCEDFPSGVEYSLMSSGRLLLADDVLRICWQVMNNSAYSVTRRGAGLKPAIRACLLVKSCNGLEDPPCSLVRCLQSLFKITQSDDKDYIASVDCVSGSNTLHDSPRVFALHLLHGLFMDAQLRVHEHPVPSENGYSPSNNWTIEALQLAVIPGFSSKKWNVWNAALQLHSVLIYRLTGATSNLQSPLIYDVCLQYPKMEDIILNCLNNNYQELSSTQSLIPVLTLIVRFSQSSDDSLILSEKFNEILEKLDYITLNHCNLHIRKLASKAYFICLNPLVDIACFYDDLSSCKYGHSSLCKISNFGPLKLMKPGHYLRNPSKMCLYNSITNAIHGQLCLLQSWYENKTSRSVRSWRESLFKVESAFMHLIQWLSISCWYLAYELCILLKSVVAEYWCNPETENSFRSQISTKLLVLPKSVFTLSNEPFHMEFLVEFYHICSVLHLQVNITHLLNIDTETDPNLLSRFLSLVKCDSDLPEEFIFKLIRYWINWRSSASVIANSRTLTNKCSTGQNSDDYLLEYANPTLMWRLLEVFTSVFTTKHYSKRIQAEFNMESILPRFWNLCSSFSCNIDGIRFCVNRSRVLYLITYFMCLSSSQFFSSHMDKWLDLLSDCLQSHNSTPSRVLASKSIELWTMNLTYQYRNLMIRHKLLPYRIYLIQQSLNVSQRKRLLDCIFQSLFDESPEVRSLMSTIVNWWLKSNTSDCMQNIGNNSDNHLADSHLIAVHKLLKQIVPLLLNEKNNAHSVHNRDDDDDDLLLCESTNWLCNSWLSVIKSMNYLLISEYESSQRNMLYEREAYNLFSEPRLLIDLLYTHLRIQENLSKKRLMRVTSALIEEADCHLQSVCESKGLRLDLVLDVESWCGPAVPVGVFTRNYSRQLVNSLK